MNDQAIFASDLHGNRYAYERLFSLAAQEGIRTVILGGDLTPKWPILSFFGKTTIPLNPKDLKPDPNGKTYFSFLESLQGWQKRRIDAEKHFVGLGGFLYHTGIELPWEQLLNEQRLLAKILETPWQRSMGSTPTPLAFTLQEIQIVERMFEAKERMDPAKRRLILQIFASLTLTMEQKQKLEVAEQDLSRLIAQRITQESPLVQYCLRKQGAHLRTADGWADAADVITLAAAVALEHPLHQWVEKAADFSRAIKPQKLFLEQYLSRRIQKYKKEVPGSRVFLILGNDDAVECRETVQRMDARGTITLISERAVELKPGLKIAGYPFVFLENTGFYQGWHKPETEIYQDLLLLEQSAGDPLRTIFVVHSPPKQTQLDQSFGHQHYGSEGVRKWLNFSRKHLVLSGHIHEAPFINGGVWQEEVAGTRCMQPGAWHDEALCAIIFELDEPQRARWIHG